MLHRLILAAALVAGLSSHAWAQNAQGQIVTPVDARGLPFGTATNPFSVTGISGGGGSSGSVTAAGTNGTAAQAVQGINGGIPVPVTTAAAPGSMEQDVRSSSTLNAATANAAISIPINGQSTVGFTFIGLTASGATLTYEQSNDGGTTWTGVSELNTGTGVTSLTRTADGQVRVSVTGRTNLRVRVSTIGTGTITVAWNISVREGLVSIASPLPPGGNAVGSVLADLRIGGAANASGNPLFAQLTAGSAILGKVGIDQTTPGTTNGVVVNSSALPTGAATAANQATEIASLGVIGQRALLFTDATNQAVGASAAFTGSTRDVGTTPPYTRFNAAVFSNQAGTLTIQACQDSGCAVAFVVASQAVVAGNFATVTANVVTRYTRAVLTNGTTAGSISLSSSYTAN